MSRANSVSAVTHKLLPYLFGGWCAFTRGFAVRAVAISANRLDFRMCRQPLLNGLGGVLIQKVDHGVMFQVHHDGAVGPPFAFCAFIHADHWRSRDCGSGAFLQPSQNCVVTDWQAYSPGEPFPRPTAECVTDQLRHFIRPAGAVSTKLSNTRQTLDKEADCALWRKISPAAHANFERDRRTKNRQVRQCSDVMAMPRYRPAATLRASSPIRPVGPYDPVGTALNNIRQPQQRGGRQQFFAG
jgi:hypothetical protein